MGDRWSFPKQGSAATYVWQPITMTGDSMSIPDFVESWQVDFESAQWSSVELTKKPIREKSQTSQGNWEVINGAKASDQKGAMATYAFNGRQVGLDAVSNNTSGYAKVIVRNNKKDEVINTIVDFYGKYEYSSLKFLSPLMKKDNYTISIEVMGEHGVWYNKAGDVFGSKGDYVVLKDVFTVK
jgi:hypothetical protein